MPETANKMWRYTRNSLIGLSIASLIAAGLAFMVANWWVQPVAAFVMQYGFFANPLNSFQLLNLLLNTIVPITIAVSAVSAALAGLGGLFRWARKKFAREPAIDEIAEHVEEPEPIIKDHLQPKNALELKSEATQKTKSKWPWLLGALIPLLLLKRKKSREQEIKGVLTPSDHLPPVPSPSSATLTPAVVQALTVFGLGVENLGQKDINKRFLRPIYIAGVKMLHPDKHPENKELYRRKLIEWQNSYEILQRYLESQPEVQQEKRTLLAIKGQDESEHLPKIKHELELTASIPKPLKKPGSEQELESKPITEEKPKPSESLATENILAKLLENTFRQSRVHSPFGVLFVPEQQMPPLFQGPTFGATTSYRLTSSEEEQKLPALNELIGEPHITLNHSGFFGESNLFAPRQIVAALCSEYPGYSKMPESFQSEFQHECDIFKIPETNPNSFANLVSRFLVRIALGSLSLSGRRQST